MLSKTPKNWLKNVNPIDISVIRPIDIDQAYNKDDKSIIN